MGDKLLTDNGVHIRKTGKDFLGFLEGTESFLFFLPCYTCSFIHALSHQHTTLFCHSSPWHIYHFIFILCDKSRFTQPLKQLFLMQDDTASFKPPPSPQYNWLGTSGTKALPFPPWRSLLSTFYLWKVTQEWNRLTFWKQENNDQKNVFSYFKLNSSR